VGVEIERKFLVTSDQWRSEIDSSDFMMQGYFGGDEHTSVRVRIVGDRAWLNIKGKTLGARRLEFEYPVPLSDAQDMLRELARKRVIAKTRHYVRHGGHCWEIDEFEGANKGLVVAEIELDAEDECFERPAWVGAEVTEEARYYNICLVTHPYADWADARPQQSDGRSNDEG
jgi:adenylate cyclase